ncbi:MAG: hypothetical protein OEW05_04105, partial [Candidatus Aminicenantes bacterium]|nr:hypothetical protein [Candidatus Aminicenantes bacterium]
MTTKLEMMALAMGIFLLLAPVSWAQGPRAAYFFHPATELGWAQCEIAFGGGSRQKIPFLPVVSTAFERAPLGTDNYRRDIQVAAPLVFIGDGTVGEGERNCYRGRRKDFSVGEIDVAGKAVLFCYDFPHPGAGPAGMAVSLAKRISEAAARKAAAVVLFSARTEYPFPTVSYENETEIPDLPAICITRASAVAILQSAGLDAEASFKTWSETGTPPESSELIGSLRLRLQGAFAKAETKNFLFRYRPEELSAKAMEAIAAVNE